MTAVSHNTSDAPVSQGHPNHTIRTGDDDRMGYMFVRRRDGSAALYKEAIGQGWILCDPDTGKESDVAVGYDVATKDWNLMEVLDDWQDAVDTYRVNAVALPRSPYTGMRGVYVGNVVDGGLGESYAVCTTGDGRVVVGHGDGESAICPNEAMDLSLMIARAATYAEREWVRMTEGGLL